MRRRRPGRRWRLSPPARGPLVLARAPALVAALALLAVQVGCSSDATDEAVLVGGERLRVESDGGRTTALIESEGGDIVEGSNAFRIEFDPAITKIAGVELFMPVHAHTSPVTPMVEPAHPGYRLGNVVFNMPGAWDVTLDVSIEGTVNRVTFTVDVP